MEKRDSPQDPTLKAAIAAWQAVAEEMGGKVTRIAFERAETVSPLISRRYHAETVNTTKNAR